MKYYELVGGVRESGGLATITYLRAHNELEIAVKLRRARVVVRIEGVREERCLQDTLVDGRIHTRVRKAPYPYENCNERSKVHKGASSRGEDTNDKNIIRHQAMNYE